MNEQTYPQVEIFTGYSNYLYEFQLVGGNPKAHLGGGLATNDWSMQSFYQAGSRINWILRNRLNSGEYLIRNGLLYNAGSECLCRPLFPEQMELFKRGLDEGGAIMTEQRREENPLFYEFIANRLAKQISSQRYSSDLLEDYKIKAKKLIEAMLTGKLLPADERGAEK